MLRRAARSTIAVLLLTTQLAACTEWRAQTMSARDLVESSHPSRLRVTRTDSSRVVLDQPALIGDTLVGQVKGSRSAVAVADVASVLGLTAAAAAAGSGGYGGSISLSGF